MNAISPSRRALMIGLPLLVWIACSILVFSPLFSLKSDWFSTGITLDLTLTAPLLYFLVIRRSQVPKMTVVRVFIAGLLLAGFLLYNKPHALLSLLKTWVAPLAEGALLFIIIKKFRQAGQSAQTLEKEEREDVLSRCRLLLTEVMGNEKLGGILASEMAVLYYAFFPHRAAPTGPDPIDPAATTNPAEPGTAASDVSIAVAPVNTIAVPSLVSSGHGEQMGTNSFTTYKTNGILLILGVFCCCFVVETVGVHFLLAMWNKKLAWIITALSAYTVLQLYAHMRAVKARPVLVTDRLLLLRNGLIADVSVNFDNIEYIESKPARFGSAQRVSIQSINKPPVTVQPVDTNIQPIKLALFKSFENHNILIRLRQPVQVHRPFGIRQKTDTLLFFVDRPEIFLPIVETKIVRAKAVGTKLPG